MCGCSKLLALVGSDTSDQRNVERLHHGVPLQLQPSQWTLWRELLLLMWTEVDGAGADNVRRQIDQELARYDAAYGVPPEREVLS